MVQPTRCQLVLVMVWVLVTSVESSLQTTWLEELNMSRQPSLSASSLERMYSVPVVVRLTQAKREKSAVEASKRRLAVSATLMKSSEPSRLKLAPYLPVAPEPQDVDALA